MSDEPNNLSVWLRQFADEQDADFDPFQAGELRAAADLIDSTLLRLDACESERDAARDERDEVRELNRTLIEDNRILQGAVNTNADLIIARRQDIKALECRLDRVLKHATNVFRDPDAYNLTAAERCLVRFAKGIINDPDVEVRCGNANCDARLSAGEPHVEGCLGGDETAVEKRNTSTGEST